MAPKVKETKAASSSTKPVRKEKKTKDPNAPKKPLSAYMFFCQASRDTIKAENPDAGFGDVGRLLGARWKVMTDGQKKPFHDMAEQDKVRAETEKAARA